MANIDTTKFMTLVVTLVVGTVLITGVLVPVIANSESGNGTTEKRLVNDLYEITSACGVTIPDKYHSYDYYSADHSTNIVLDRDEMLALYDISISSTSDYNLNVPLLVVWFPNNTSETYPNWNGFEISWCDETYYGYFGQYYNIGVPSDWSEFELNFSTGILHIVDESNTTLDIQVSEAYVISENEEGVLPFIVGNGERQALSMDDSIPLLTIEKGVKTNGNVSIELVDDQSDAYFFIGHFDDTTIQFTDGGISIPNTTLTESDDPDNNSTCTMDITVSKQNSLFYERGDMEYSNMTCTEGYSVGDDPYPMYEINVISTMAYSEGSGGSDSPAMTILYVVPLLMIVGMVLLTMNFVFKKE